MLTNAVTTKPIVYSKNGQQILVASNTDIFVDTENSIALIGVDHVDISKSEYSLYN